MKNNKWTLALASLGVISLGSTAYAEEEVMSQVLTGVSSTTLSGYVDTSAFWMTGPSGALPGRFNDGAAYMDGFNLDVVGLTIEKPLGEDLWASGYRVDLLFGPNAIGYNNVVNPGGSGNESFGIKQAYVNLMTPIGNGLEWKMGVFDTIIGYESFTSYVNPNFGRSYGWNLEPTQHTGLLASYDVTEAVSVNAGIANTWIWGINTRPTSAFGWLGSVSVTAPDSWGFLSGSSLTGGIVTGGTSGGNTRNTISYYAGLNLLTGLEGFSVGIAFDYREGGANAVTVGDNWAWAGAGYLVYNVDKWTFAGRADFTKGSDGTFYTGFNNQNELFSFTGTIDYSLWENVITRFELRYDTAMNSNTPFGVTDAAGITTAENAFTLGVNAVYVF